MFARCALLLLIAVPCFGQNTGSATASGPCSAAVTGTVNQITLTCPGTSKEELDKISRALNKLLSTQPDVAALNKKLDEILSAIAAIKPVSRTLTPVQEEAFKKALSAVANGSLMIMPASTSDDVGPLMNQIKELAKSVGWDVGGGSLIGWGGGLAVQEDGLKCYSGKRSWDDPFAKAFRAAINAANMKCKYFEEPYSSNGMTLGQSTLVIGRNVPSQDTMDCKDSNCIQNNFGTASQVVNNTPPPRTIPKEKEQAFVEELKKYDVGGTLVLIKATSGDDVALIYNQLVTLATRGEWHVNAIANGSLATTGNEPDIVGLECHSWEGWDSRKSQALKKALEAGGLKCVYIEGQYRFGLRRTKELTIVIGRRGE